jgi:hypothetical protein
MSNGVDDYPMVKPANTIPKTGQKVPKPASPVGWVERSETHRLAAAITAR